MTRQGSVDRLGIDLGTLDSEPVAQSVPDCPGARLRLTRHDFDALRAGGEVFATKREDIPYDAYGDARVRCEQSVAQLPKTMATYPQFYGLCHSCSGLEARNREDLRERARAKGDR